ncbi:metallophosphoesterase [Barrientosiimonas marina]|uniref:Metallophosphoesterase n=1 Tax=Lentibacillus kimchii TaxID=1542911 RepID=A0ABW2UWP6_9BACI
MKKLLAILGFILVMITCSARIYRDTYHFKLKEVFLSSGKLPKGEMLSVLQISDLHDHVFGPDNKQLIRTVKQADPDLIVLTGDLIDRKTTSFSNVLSLIDQLIAINKHIYFVPGNHEWGNNRTNAFLSSLYARGITILANRNVQLTKRGLTVNLAGTDDPATERDNLDDAFCGLTSSHYTILLAHAPEIVTIADSIPADLILSGHTHGGQVRFPFIGALVAPGQGVYPKLDKGTYQLGPEQYVYIDSGLGTTRLPIRFLNQSQLSLVTITGKPEISFEQPD